MNNKCISYYYEKGKKYNIEKCRCYKDIKKCGHYFICYMPNFIKKEYEIHYGE